MGSEINTIRSFCISEKAKIVIILSVVGFFASQKLYFKILYQINFPQGMDFFNGINYLFTYVKTGVFPFGELITPISGHIHIFPRLVALPNFLFNSFDVANLFYLHWGLESITLFLIFLLLKKTSSKFYWLLIPISAFIYSPLQDSNYWSFAIILWLLPAVGITGIVYFLDKKLNLKFLAAAVGLAVVSTFSITIGIVAWLVGIIGLIKFDRHHKKLIKKKFLSIWIACTVITGLIFYSQWPTDTNQPNFAFLFTIDGFYFVTTFISSAFRLKYHFLMVLVGSFSLILGSFSVYYFTVVKKNLKIAFPWILFLVVGVGGALITAIGRGDLPLHYGNEPYYIPISQFFQIGLLVLILLIMIDLKKTPSHTRKKILFYFLLAVIIAHMVLLIPSYYAGWLRGDHYFQIKTDYANCFSLSPKLDCLEPTTEVNMGMGEDTTHPMINYWIENKLSIFGDTKFNKKNLEHVSYFEETWNKNDKTLLGIGNIELINEVTTNKKTTIYLDDQLVVISGWMLDEEGKQLDSTYLLVNDKPFIQFDDFQPRKDVIEKFGDNMELYSGWEIFFMSGYLENNCQTISIAGLKDDKNIRLNQEIKLCKSNMD